MEHLQVFLPSTRTWGIIPLLIGEDLLWQHCLPSTTDPHYGLAGQAPKNWDRHHTETQVASGTMGLVYSNLRGKNMGRAQKASSSVAFSQRLSVKLLSIYHFFPTQVAHFSLSDLYKSLLLLSLTQLPSFFQSELFNFLSLIGLLTFSGICCYLNSHKVNIC